MKPVDRYLKEVLRAVFASADEKTRLEADLRAHFEEGMARGDSPSQVIERMGRPEDVAAAFNAERRPRYAGFWVRLLAFCADLGLILTFSLPCIAGVLLVASPQGAEVEVGIAGALVLALCAMTIAGAFLLYFPLLEGRFGRTLGKLLLGLRVIREAGAPISMGQAFLRRLPFYFEMLAPDALFIPFTRKRQRAFDILAKTVVAHEPGAAVHWWGWGLSMLLIVLPLGCFWALLMLCAPLAFGA